MFPAVQYACYITHWSLSWRTATKSAKAAKHAPMQTGHFCAESTQSLSKTGFAYIPWIDVWNPIFAFHPCYNPPSRVSRTLAPNSRNLQRAAQPRVHTLPAHNSLHPPPTHHPPLLLPSLHLPGYLTQLHPTAGASNGPPNPGCTHCLHMIPCTPPPHTTPLSFCPPSTYQGISHSCTQQQERPTGRPTQGAHIACT
jgi:hypothetical protein